MKIYNSLTRKKETLEPIKKNQVGMYVCGPTVYDEPHIGHARASYIFEVIRNYFEYKGYKVKFVKNITDVDDKIIARAKEELPDLAINEAVKEIAEKYTKKYYEDMGVLGIHRASDEPKATGHIKEMQDFISRLIKKKFAYEVDGNVYFDVRKFKDYGKLSGQNLDQMHSAVRIEKDERKKDALDFALWKKAGQDEPFWDSPWSSGRPGWHIECSVMAGIYLGDEFDIHGGGRDLIFPHHENEIAQSRACSGKKFARIWMHNGLLTINRQKMAKSLGNFISLRDFLKEYTSPSILKFFFLSAHYRSPVDYNEERIHEAKKNYDRFQIFFGKLNRSLKRKGKVKASRDVLKFKKRFEQAMDDDFNTPEALAALFGLVNFCNKLLDDYDEKYQDALRAARQMLEDAAEIFGIRLETSDITSDFRMKKEVSKTKIEALIKTREDLRKKDNFAEADRIRKRLEEKGIILEDTKEETVWRRKI